MLLGVGHVVSLSNNNGRDKLISLLLCPVNDFNEKLYKWMMTWGLSCLVT